MENVNFIGFKSQKIINLGNVSNIYIDTGGQKVIFNLNYSIKIFNGKFTPDYVYWKYDSAKELQEIQDLLLENTKGWILPAEAGQRYLNPKYVASVTLDVNKTRVIFNLNYNVTHPKDINKLTSDFVFYDFASLAIYETFIKNITSQVKYTK